MVQEVVAYRRHLQAAKHGALRERLRAWLGGNPQPSAGMVDSQSTKMSGVDGEARGYDGAKKVRGRKRHLLVDTEGLVLKAKVHKCQGARPGRDQATSEGRSRTPRTLLSSIGGRRLPGQG
ncbi:MAG: hypothetical protein JOZ19_05080 [Rubrobacter sp.]|nr:hypothetical protein [Rubrobacter sp.]